MALWIMMIVGSEAVQSRADGNAAVQLSSRWGKGAATRHVSAGRAGR
jgi:hypothetical protein